MKRTIRDLFLTVIQNVWKYTRNVNHFHLSTPTVQTSNVHSCPANFVADFMSQLHSPPPSFTLKMETTMYADMFKAISTHDVAKPWQPKLKKYICLTQMSGSLCLINGHKNTELKVGWIILLQTDDMVSVWGKNCLWGVHSHLCCHLVTLGGVCAFNLMCNI